ncbi:hypothetical protein [Limosilactobacillus equigenerosi]|uniref:Uncharacterized protein n=1 Tax=Limosilactobacillus equigenerosi DSM 18793 = JCM 14505 TaxID=1423742 RepID=A0A0R1ULM1_9LACO|nr:hypothetical protein [Limosilactobacillus equigenerosi]KRL91861.1 hypothetical protein FC21_GL000631 [Limosilactobacillus equigenerosi DSM 18793 = JCM 14505]
MIELNTAIKNGFSNSYGTLELKKWVGAKPMKVAGNPVEVDYKTWEKAQFGMHIVDIDGVMIPTSKLIAM